MELIRKGVAALRRVRESESRYASGRDVAGEGAALPIRSCGTDQPRQPADTWGHPGGTKRRAAAKRPAPRLEWMRAGPPNGNLPPTRERGGNNPGAIGTLLRVLV